jgi:hypothetical protein
MGVLADAVHLFPVHQEDPACGDWRVLSGFSILEDGTWLTSTPADPWQDLKMGTSVGVLLLDRQQVPDARQRLWRREHDAGDGVGPERGRRTEPRSS